MRLGSDGSTLSTLLGTPGSSAPGVPVTGCQVCPRSVVLKHALRNSLIPVVTIIGVELGKAVQALQEASLWLGGNAKVVRDRVARGAASRHAVHPVDGVARSRPRPRSLSEAAALIHPHAAPDGGDADVPTTILVDRRGTVRWIYRSPSVIARLSPGEVLQAIDQNIP